MHDESIILQTWRTEDIANTRDVYTTCIYVSANANQIKLLKIHRVWRFHTWVERDFLNELVWNRVVSIFQIFFYHDVNRDPKVW